MALSIVIDLLMRTGSFETDSKRAEKRLREFKKEAAQIGRAIATAFTAGAAALTAMTAQTVSSASQIMRLTAITGTGAGEFQRYAAGASLMGIEQEKLADIFKDAQDKVGDFLQTGGGPLADFFENIAPKIGVTAEQFRHLSGPEALQLYVKSLEDAGVAQSEMVFFMEAIASDATLLLPLLRNNAEGFKTLGDAAAYAGAIMGDDLLRSAVEMQATTFLLRQQLTGLRNDVATDVLPTLTDLGSAMVGVSGDSVLLDESVRILNATLRTISGTATGVVAAVSLTGRAIAGLATVVTAGDVRLTDFLVPTPDAMMRIARSGADIKRAYEIAFRDIQATALEFGEILNGIWSAGSDDDKSNADARIQQIASFLQEIEKMRAQLRANAGSPTGKPGKFEGVLPKRAPFIDVRPIKELEEGFRDAASLVAATRTEVERLEFQIAETQRLADAGFLTDERAKEVTERLREQLAEASKETNVFLEEASKNTQQIIADGLMNGFDDGIDGMLKAFANMLKQMAAQAIAADIGRLVFGGGGVGSGGGLIGRIFGGGRAVGGAVSAGITYRVNELEPEFFRPSTSGVVVPLSRMGGMRGGINQTINVPLAFPPQLEAYVRNVAGPAGRDAAMAVLLAREGRVI